MIVGEGEGVGRGAGVIVTVNVGGRVGDDVTIGDPLYVSEGDGREGVGERVALRELSGEWDVETVSVMVIEGVWDGRVLVTVMVLDGSPDGEGPVGVGLLRCVTVAVPSPVGVFERENPFRCRDEESVAVNEIVCLSVADVSLAEEVSEGLIGELAEIEELGISRLSDTVPVYCAVNDRVCHPSPL